MNIFWFRRDLRIFDNTGLFNCLKERKDVQPIFIFDTNITGELETDDPRISFIYENLTSIHSKLLSFSSSLKIYAGDPLTIFKQILNENNVESVYINRDYEPYATKRDDSISEFLSKRNVAFKSFKDHVIFEKSEVVKKDGLPYTVFTPYKNKWLEKYQESKITVNEKLESSNFLQSNHKLPKIEVLGFKVATIKVPEFNINNVPDYDLTRNIPSLDSTSKIGPHLRFGTVSIRKIVQSVKSLNSVYLSELVWREFFIQILHHFPKVVTENFRSKYNSIVWNNNTKDFENWCNGKTGYPIVDAGMNELNTTGFMHNRVRMVTASFLCKHLLIDWRWGEAYFAKKLLDYELASNNGNWQWCAGTGCDSSPYFRIFNPYEQTKKFDKDLSYINKWVDNLNSFEYPSPIVEHKWARNRALEAYKTGLAKN